MGVPKRYRELTGLSEQTQKNGAGGQLDKAKEESLQKYLRANFTRKLKGLNAKNFTIFTALCGGFCA